jgi:hypothetical protein
LKTVAIFVLNKLRHGNLICIKVSRENLSSTFTSRGWVVKE